MKMFKNISKKKIKFSKIEKKISKLINLNRVVKVTKGGRDFSYRALVVIGNGFGIIGYGSGKSRELSESISKAEEKAKKNLFKINLFNNRIPHEQESVYSGSRVFIKPASKGTGIIAGGPIRSVLEAAGIKDVLSKSKGSSNCYNVVKATFKALINIRDLKTISKERGISIEKIFEG